MGRGFFQWQIAEFVDDEKLGLGEECDVRIEFAFALRSGKSREQCSCGDKQNAVARFDRSAAKRDRQVRFADAWRRSTRT